MPDGTRSAVAARRLSFALVIVAGLAAAVGLCRRVDAAGEEIGPKDKVVETLAVLATSNRCPADCDADGLPDGCADRVLPAPDSNGNDTSAQCGIQGEASSDCNRDDVPDECQVAACELNDGIIMLSVSGPDEIAWYPERGYNSFNLYRGSLSWLSDTRTVAAEAPLAKADRLSGRDCDLTQVTIRDELVPAPGEAIYYRATGNRLGAEHRTSIDGNGASRSNSRPCPAPARPWDVSVRTDKADYEPGETVRIEVFLANLNPTSEIDLRFATRCRVTFRIEDLKGASIYLELSHRSCAYDHNRLMLRPGQIAMYDFAWDQKDDRGRPVAPISDYVVRGMVLYQDPIPDGITGISIRPRIGIRPLRGPQCPVREPLPASPADP
jgi:hypothetical protein